MMAMVMMVMMVEMVTAVNQSLWSSEAEKKTNIRRLRKRRSTH